MQQTFSVSELNRQVRSELETTFGNVWVEGEISNLARPASGHLYFSLKDDSAQISCALFKGSRFGLKMAVGDIANGVAVRARGRVSLYEPRGSYQLIINQLEAAGQGALEQAFKARQAALAAEGLFDVAHKQAIPSQPRRIGIITSASGAAVHDALTTLKRRHPLLPVIIYPSMVQGDDAPAQLCAQIATANRRAECDVLLLIRGGGSLEDLWAFNSPELVRAIVASRIPIISGIGHEIDVTLADLAADLRAPTPTAAAEQAVPELGDIQRHYATRLAHLNQRLARCLHQQQRYLAQLQHRLHLQNPIRQLHTHSQRCDELSQRLTRIMQRYLGQRQQQVAQLGQRLSSAPLARRIDRERQSIAQCRQRLHQAVNAQYRRDRQRLAYLMQSLHNLSPLNILGRGYALAFDGDQRLIRRSSDVADGARICVRLGEGQLDCTVVARQPDGTS